MAGTQRRRPHRAAAALAALIVLTGLAAGCTSSTGGKGDNGTGGPRPSASDPAPPADADSIAGMLALLPPPAGGQLAELISVTRWHAAADAYGIEVPGPDATDDEILDYLLALTIDKGGLSSSSDLMSVQVAARESTEEQFGYLRQSIAAEATYGQPPRILQAARGDFDPDAIAAATKAGPVAADVKEVEVDGVPVLRWRDDFQIDVKMTSALSRVGTAGRLAAPDDQTLLYTTYDDGIAGLIDAQQGGDSVGDDDDVAAVARALDEQDALSALIAPKPGDDGLEYNVAGIGFAWDGQPRMILAYSTDSSSDAEALADQVTTLVTTGRTLATKQPWADVLADPQVAANGSVVTATFTLKGAASRWASFYYSRENLF